jgi:hypothetical protein
MPDYTAHYAETEKQLLELLQKVAGLLTAGDLADANEFLAAREYGLALETIAGGLVDRKQGIQREIVERVDAIARPMHLANTSFVKDVHSHAVR